MNNPLPCDSSSGSQTFRKAGHFLSRCGALILLLLTTQVAMAVTAGGFHSLAIKSDGTLWAWGRNSDGQLGNGTIVSSPLPVQIGSGFSMLAAGSRHSLALKPDRTLWAWGYNANGQLGDGTQIDRKTPVMIGGSYSSIAAGELHSIALETDGSLWAWGYNANGQLGDGTTTDRANAVLVGTGFISIAAGYQHTLALKNDGTLWAWGKNEDGQLGDGTTTNRSSPVLIGAGFSLMAAGQSHSVALKADGSLWTWGANTLGQLGNGTTASQNLPKQIGVNFHYLAAGVAHTAALKTDGQLWAWGYNGFGQLGDGTKDNRNIPVLIDSNMISVTAGYAHTLATKTDGRLWSWGYNTSGQLGDGTSGPNNPPQLRPVQTSLTAGFIDNQAPTVPSGLVAVPVSSTQVNIEWAVSTDNVGVSAYKLYRDDQLYAVLGNVVRFSNTALKTDTTRYSYALAACDEANNCSARSPAVKTLIYTPSGLATPIETTSQVVSNPSANLTVDTSGALVVTAQTSPIVLSSAAPENALIKLQTTETVSITSGKTTLEYTDQVGSAQLVIRTVDNQPQLEVAKGTVQINSPASGNTISVVSSNQKTVGSFVTQTTGDKVIVEKTDTTAAFFVDTGKVKYQGPAQTAAAVDVYQGENTQLNATGALNQLALGSLGGKKQVPGDPLPVTTTSKDTNTKVPNLEGTLARFNNTLTLQEIVGEMIKGLVGDTKGIGKLTYDKSTGVITYVVGTAIYRLIALGDVLVQLNQFAATNVSATAGAAYSLASRGIQMSLSGALGYFSDLQTVVKAADANGTLSLKPTGAIEARLGGGHYVVMPGSTASLPSTPTPSVGFDSADGYLVFRDHLGTLQTLYPAFLEVDTLNATFKVAAPAFILTNKADGTVTAAISGQNFALRPEYMVVDQPVGHSAESYWQENGTIYLRNADLSAQGFKVQ